MLYFNKVFSEGVSMITILTRGFSSVADLDAAVDAAEANLERRLQAAAGAPPATTQENLSAYEERLALYAHQLLIQRGLGQYASPPPQTKNPASSPS